MIKNEEKAIMISVNPPYSQMIVEQYKMIEFRNKPIMNMKNGDLIWIYETKNKKGRGRVIGRCIVETLIPLDFLYNKDTENIDTWNELYGRYRKVLWNHSLEHDISTPLVPTLEYVVEVHVSMLALYSRYRDILINSDSGFHVGINNKEEYGKSIGEGIGKYAILLKDFVPVDLEISKFRSCRTNKALTRPPQNMSCVRRVL